MPNPGAYDLNGDGFGDVERCNFKYGPPVIPQAPTAEVTIPTETGGNQYYEVDSGDVTSFQVHGNDVDGDMGRMILYERPYIPGSGWDPTWPPHPLWGWIWDFDCGAPIPNPVWSSCPSGDETLNSPDTRAFTAPVEVPLGGGQQ